MHEARLSRGPLVLPFFILIVSRICLGKYGLAFIASIVRSEFERVTKPIIKGTSDSVITLFEELDKITATLSLNGKHYTRWYALTQRQKQIFTPFNITEKTIDSSLEKLAPNECQL